MRRDNKFHFLIGIIIFILIGALIFGVLSHLNKDDEVVLKDNVFVITMETGAYVKPYVVRENQMIFENNPNYKVGDVIVSGVTEEAPYGYIRRIVGIEIINGEYCYHTEYATLLDVFEEVHIKETVALTVNEDTVVQIGTPEYLVSNNNDINEAVVNTLFYAKESKDNEDMDDLFCIEFERDIDEDVHIEGEVGAKLWLDFSLDIEKGDLTWGMTANARTHGELLFGFSTSKIDQFEEELLKIMPPTFTVWAGPVPIVLTNEVTCQLEGEYEIEGDIGTEFGINTTLSAGFLYTSKNNKVKEVVGKVTPFCGMDWNSSVGLEGKINGGVFVYLTTFLYDCCGAEIGVGLEGQAKGNVSLSLKKNLQGELDLAVYPQTKGSIIVGIPILGEDLYDVPLFEKSLAPLWTKKWKNTEVDLETDANDEMSIVLDGTDNAHDDLQSECMHIYSKIIKAMKQQQGNERISFVERFFADGANVRDDERGGVSTDYSFGPGNIVFYMKDINNSVDAMPELFIGLETEQRISIMAVYSYNMTKHMAFCVSAVYETYPEIVLCTNNMLLEKDGKYGHFIMLTEEGKCISWSAFRSDQDQGSMIDTDTLEWESIDNWIFY